MIPDDIAGLRLSRVKNGYVVETAHSWWLQNRDAPHERETYVFATLQDLYAWLRKNFRVAPE